MSWAGNMAKTMTSNGKQFTVTREILTAIACDQSWPDVLSLESQRVFQNLLFALFCYKCLNQVYESSASTFAINDPLKGSK